MFSLDTQTHKKREAVPMWKESRLTSSNNITLYRLDETRDNLITAQLIQLVYKVQNFKHDSFSPLALRIFPHTKQAGVLSTWTPFPLWWFLKVVKGHRTGQGFPRTKGENFFWKKHVFRGHLTVQGFMLGFFKCTYLIGMLFFCWCLWLAGRWQIRGMANVLPSRRCPTCSSRSSRLNGSFVS